MNKYKFLSIVGILILVVGCVVMNSQIFASQQTTFNPESDMYISSGTKNRNKGGSDILKVQASGQTKAFVNFGSGPQNLDIGGSGIQLQSAILRLTITNNGGGWGSAGRMIDVHRVVRSWTEGNGTESSHGTGVGATWNCASDSDISDGGQDCVGVDEWDLTNPSTIWNSTPTDTITMQNGQTGVVDFDVTQDLQGYIDGNYTNFGWIVKKADTQSGSVEFGSKDSTSKPELIVTYTSN